VHFSHASKFFLKLRKRQPDNHSNAPGNLGSWFGWRGMAEQHQFLKRNVANAVTNQRGRCK
jgi:hypothetical protein